MTADDIHAGDYLRRRLDYSGSRGMTVVVLLVHPKVIVVEDSRGWPHAWGDAASLRGEPLEKVLPYLRPATTAEIERFDNARSAEVKQ